MQLLLPTVRDSLHLSLEGSALPNKCLADLACAVLVAQLPPAPTRRFCAAARPRVRCVMHRYLRLV